MAGDSIRKALFVSAAVYLLAIVFVFWNEGGLQVKEKKVVVRASPTDRKIFIPKISVEAHIQTVSTTKDGAVGIPTNYSDVAWFDGSAPIGRSVGTTMAGTALVVGHVDTRVFGPGVFRDLKGLVPGDDIYVSIEGRISHFKVTGLKTYPEDTDRMAEIIGTKGGKAHLNLITCDGEWDQSVKRYTDRLVVFTDLVE